MSFVTQLSGSARETTAGRYGWANGMLIVAGISAVGSTGVAGDSRLA